MTNLELERVFNEAIEKMPPNQDMDVISALAGLFGLCLVMYQLSIFIKWAYSMARSSIHANKSMSKRR